MCRKCNDWAAWLDNDEASTILYILEGERYREEIEKTFEYRWFTLGRRLTELGHKIQGLFNG